MLKPQDQTLETLEWLDAVVRPRLRDAPIRVTLPERSRDGELVVAGWTAARHLPGEHEVDRWDEVAAVGRVFAAAMGDAPRPAFLDARDDPWARADRLAWEGPATRADDDVVARVPHVPDLLAVRRPVEARPRIVHGDLSGNVLFAADAPPALLDLSLYWRPVEYATAVVGVDAVCWHGAPLDLLTSLGAHAAPGSFGQLLVRALLFRLVADALNGRPTDGVGGYEAYAACAARVLSLGRTSA